MQEELKKFERNNVQTLVKRPKNHPKIGTKQAFQNKLNKQENVIRNKARLLT